LFIYTIVVNTIIYIPQMDFVCFQNGKHVPVRVKMLLSCLYINIFAKKESEIKISGVSIFWRHHITTWKFSSFCSRRGGLLLLQSPLGQKGNIYT
jgi:hypothetical protein